MNLDLKIIKDKYGEKMMHLCRELFPTLLETEGLLPKLLTSAFEESHFLYNDIVSSNNNDIVNNPDSTFSNNLDNIIPGLMNAFEREYNLNLSDLEQASFGLENYIRASDGKYYKYNEI